MSLFNHGKKKETAKKPACTCGGVCPASEAAETTGACCDEAAGNNGLCGEETGGGICCIRVLGSGCKNCHALFESTKEAVRNMGLPVEVEYITDMQKIMEYGVMSMPALVVNENVASMGKVLKAGEVESLLRKY